MHQSSQFQQYTQMEVPILQQLMLPSEDLGGQVAEVPPQKRGRDKPKHVRQPRTFQQCLRQVPACRRGWGKWLCTTGRGDS
eukprot:2435026-Rhodomonas_salina.1